MDPNSDDLTRYGSAIAIDGDYAVVGAPDAGGPGLNDEGAAFVFQKIRGSWVRTASLDHSDWIRGFDPLDDVTTNFGFSVAIKGDIIAVGFRYGVGFYPDLVEYCSFRDPMYVKRPG